MVKIIGGVILCAVVCSPVLAQDDEAFLPGLNAVESEDGFELFLKTAAFVAAAIELREQRGVFSENAYELGAFLGRLEPVVRVESEANTSRSVGRAFWVATDTDTEGTLIELHMPPDQNPAVLTIVAKRPGIPTECAVRMRVAIAGDEPSPIQGFVLQAWCTNIRNDARRETEDMLGFFVPMLKGRR